MAASFIRRWRSGDTSAVFQTAANHPNHTVDTLFVIDWITVTIGSTTGGNSSFRLTFSDGTGADSTLNGHLILVTIPLAAGDSDTLHLPFPGGLPVVKALSATAGQNVLEDTLGNTPGVGNLLTLGLADNADSGTAFVGYHLERQGNRK